jgi:hypothetical protein
MPLSFSVAKALVQLIVTSRLLSRADVGSWGVSLKCSRTIVWMCIQTIDSSLTNNRLSPIRTHTPYFYCAVLKINRVYVATDERRTEGLSHLASQGAINFDDLLARAGRRGVDWSLMLADVPTIVEQDFLAHSTWFTGQDDVGSGSSYKAPAMVYKVSIRSSFTPSKLAPHC